MKPVQKHVYNYWSFKYRQLANNKAQSGVSSSLSRLLVSVERYPELKANQNFLLQDELVALKIKFYGQNV
jgi:hypothetical protein